MHSSLQTSLVETFAFVRGATGRRCMGGALAAAMAFSGCGTTSQSGAPRLLQGTASATPLPPSYSQPPAEPLPPAPASVAVDPPSPEPPSPAMPVAPPPSPSNNPEIEQLKAEIAELKKGQEASQLALESLTTSATATASRAAAIEAHIALQSSLIDDLRVAAQQQQREQWKALDAVSEGIDRMLKKSGAEPSTRPTPVPPPGSGPPSPGDVPLEEILSQQPGESTGRKLQ